MIISCTCGKKLQVKAELAGKRIKCAGCGQIMVAPVEAATVAQAVGVQKPPPAPGLSDVGTQGPTLPPVSSSSPKQGMAGPSELPTMPPPSSSDLPTMPPFSSAGRTEDSTVAKPGPDLSLTGFLAPPQSEGELGRLGDFRILKILGHGGMGVVFQGEDVQLGRQVAIKAMLPHLALSPSSQQRFLREARAAANLEHENIVAIHHVGQERGSLYIVMPLLKGQSLEDCLQSVEKLPPALVMLIGRETASALAAAHKAGLVHRDIKPANIWLENKLSDQDATHDRQRTTDNFRVKVLDFGLARAVADESGLTQQGAVVGTPAYMAPEQGRGGSIDARSDLFSLGVVLYRLSTGKPPFRGTDTVSTLMAVATEEPPPPHTINPEVPPELSDLVMKLLEKDPASRIASAQEVVKMLQAMEQKPLRKPVREPSTQADAAAPTVQAMAGPLLSSRWRRPVVLAALCALFGLVAAGVIFCWPANNDVVTTDKVPGSKEVPQPENKVEKTGPGGAALLTLAEAIRQGKVPAPDLSKAALYYKADFADPRSGWDVESDDDWKSGYADGKYFIAVSALDFPKNFPCPAGPWKDFACEVVGNVSGGTGAAWELEIEGKNKKYSLGFQLGGAQKLSIFNDVDEGDDTLVHSATHTAIKPGSAFNRLLLVARKKGEKDIRFDIYVNGVAVSEPFVTSFIKMPCKITLGVASGKDKPARAEFQELRVFAADTLPTLEQQAGPMTAATKGDAGGKGQLP